jgi:hypothetical protein
MKAAVLLVNLVLGSSIDLVLSEASVAFIWCLQQEISKMIA